MTFKELREKSGMNKTDFSKYFGIPYRTVQNWELGLRECPEYLLDLMQYKLEKEDIAKAEEILVKAHREAALLALKNTMKAHEEWKKQHPRPKHKKEIKKEGTAD